MIITKPYYEIEPINGTEILQRLEKIGRTCYKSEDKISPESAPKFIRGILKRGHESIIEHEKVTVRIVCDRGITHEIVRHRLASYSQESTRYCNYGGDAGITFILPPWVKLWDDFIPNQFFGIHYSVGNGLYINNVPKLVSDPASLVWLIAMYNAERAYQGLLSEGADWKPQQARSVLPNSLKTEIVCTYNLRTWRHIFRLRALGTTGAPHPQMLEIMVPLLKEFKMLIPVIFDDLKIEED